MQINVLHGMFIQNLLQQVFYKNIWLSSSSFLTWFHYNLESFKKISIFSPCRVIENFDREGCEGLKDQHFITRISRGGGGSIKKPSMGGI